MKYNVGDVKYTKKTIKDIPYNTQVVIMAVTKKGRKTFVDIQDDDGNKAVNIHANVYLRNRRR